MSLVAQLMGGRRRAEQSVTCPSDRLRFAPRYTDGVCPLCGWRPEEGVDLRPPLAARLDRFWLALGVWVAVSVAMMTLVLLAYARG